MTQEEILFRLGVDGSSLQSGLRMVHERLQDFGGKSVKLLHHIFATGLVNALRDAVDVASRLTSEIIYSAANKQAEADAIVLDSRRNMFRKLREEAAKEEKAEAERAEREKQRQERLEQISRTLRDLREANDLLQKGWGSDSTLAKEQKIEQLKREELRLSELIADSTLDVEERGKLQVKLEETKRDRMKEQNDLLDAAKEKQSAWAAFIRDQKEKLAEVNKELATSEARLSRMKESEFDRFRPSIQELAGVGGWMPRQASLGTAFAGTARNIMNLEVLAKEQFSYGNIGGAKASITRRNDIYDTLADAGIVPQRQERGTEATIKMEEHIRELKEHKATLLVKAKTGR